MWLSDTSVKRPVFATVLSLMLLAIGALAFRDLTVREYPDTVQPTVQVQVGYPGASAEIIETRITQVLEAELSGIEGVKSIRSQSRDGQSSITVEFYMNRKLDEAANDVRDRVSRVTRRLPDDVENALTRENLELPAGRVISKDLDFQVRIARNYETADQFRNLVISQGKDGHLVRLGEVANVVVASRETNRMFRTNGQLTTGFGIIKQSTANTVEVLDQVKAEVERVNANLPPGMKLITSGDDSLYIRAAISEIYWTIGITTLLVGFVIFVFLGSLRATLIPLVTIPVCLIATFSVLSLFGYSINLITLLALALSIGLVVDDAIVVLENAHRRIEAGEAPLLAAFNGTRQVAFAVIATTVVLVSVFAPVAFLKDSIGRVFAELAVTIAAAVIFSAVLALSLSPMMCSKLLRSSTRESKLTHTLDGAFVWLSNRYQTVLRGTLRAPWVSVALCAAIAFGAYVLVQNIPREYAPQEDRGQFNGSIQAPEGTSFSRLKRAADQVEIALKPYFDDGTIVRGVVSVPGWNNQAGIVNVTLKPWGERNIDTQSLINILSKQWEEIPDVRVTAFMNNGNRGGGGGGGQPVQLVLGGPNYD